MKLIKIDDDLYVDADEVVSVETSYMTDYDMRTTANGSFIKLKNGYSIRSEFTPEQVVKLLTQP